MQTSNGILFATLNPDGTLTGQRTLSKDSIAKCRHFIFAAEHYRDDGSCKCDDAAHREFMKREWEYSDADFEGIALRAAAPVTSDAAPGSAVTPRMTGDRLAGDPDALLVARKWTEPAGDLRVCNRLFMTSDYRGVVDFLAMRRDHTGEWVVALHAAYEHDAESMDSVATRRALLAADGEDFAVKLAAALRPLRRTVRKAGR
jgi:hypothetical protein